MTHSTEQNPITVSVLTSTGGRYRFKRGKTHHLKTWPKHFQAIRQNLKTADLRIDDREFVVGDVLVLDEYDPEADRYTLETIHAQVTHILTGSDHEMDGIKAGYVMLSFTRLT